MRLRLKKDGSVQDRLQTIVRRMEREHRDQVAIPRYMYRQLRKGIKEFTQPHMNIDVSFMIATTSLRLSVPITRERCESQNIVTFLRRHAVRTRRLAQFYHDLGYPSIYVLLRPGEEEFMKLTKCLMNEKSGGQVITIDYGASFEPLSHSLSVDPRYDGIFVPPIPNELMMELPNCHNNWPVCAGRIDWTTFVDFTNM